MMPGTKTKPMRKITAENLKPWVGTTVTVSCTVGVCFYQLAGKLLDGYGFCQWGVEIGNGNKIGFTFGTFTENNGTVHISIS